MTRKSTDGFTPSGVQGGIFGHDFAALTDQALARRTGTLQNTGAADASTPTQPLAPPTEAGGPDASARSPTRGTARPRDGHDRSPRGGARGTPGERTNSQVDGASAAPAASIRRPASAETGVKLPPDREPATSSASTSRLPGPMAGVNLTPSLPASSGHLSAQEVGVKPAPKLTPDAPATGKKAPRTTRQAPRPTATAASAGAASGITGPAAAGRPAAAPAASSKGHRALLGKRVRRTLRIAPQVDGSLRALAELLGSTLNDALSIAIVEHCAYLNRASRPDGQGDDS